MAFVTEESNTATETLSSTTMFNGGSITNIAQTFAANRDYTLQAVVLYVAANSPPLSTSGGIYSVSGGEPNSKLEDFTITATQDTGSFQEETATLDSPLALTEGVEYAIVLDAPASDFFSVAFLNTGSSSYPNGIGLRKSSGSWSALSSNHDYYFRTYSTFSLTPTPGNAATGIALYPTLSWVVD